MVFPLSDDNRDRLIFPWVNVSLIAVNIFVFVVLQGMGANESFTMAFSTVPREIITGKDQVSADEVKTFQTAEGPVQVKIPGLKKTPGSVYLTLLTSMFMHGSLAHIAGNMWFLWIFGDNIENDLGRFRYLLFYLLTGLVASLTHVLVSASGPSSLIPSLGASGAISGVMGGYLMLHPHRQVTVLLFRFITQVPGYVAVGLWFGFQIVSSLQVLGGSGDGVAYGAHIGGFIAGAALVKLFTLGLPENKPLTDTQRPTSYGKPRGDYYR
ncbi:Rhomboid protease GluP [Anatilimnocola aggregata]|uniref:Rhomboid protease GluP n=1 Tax=Anatilimnocola aggregata TaxID=2528021 RepID=A0A517YLD6_9BACT|nr:rhomboid family intramembrane serine protease [Anatilimnocola aggregata]QDU31018.1 Rhomboid protease GluP [Anatilimnocola aggregata]